MAGCTVCSAEARTSVRVSVEDADGAPLDVDTVTFSNPGEFTERDCTQFAVGDWSCGQEAEGNLVVRVTRGAQEVEREVDVSADRCHVETEEITVVLDM